MNRVEFENAPCGFLCFTDEGRIVEVNHTLARLLGYDPAELAHAKVEKIFPISTQVFYQTHFLPLLLLHGKAEEIFMMLKTKSGQSIPTLAYAQRREGVQDCVFVTVHERQKYEEEILAAKRTAEEALRNNQELLATKRQLQAQSQELDRRIAEADQKNRELLQVTRILFHHLREPIRKIETFSNMLSDTPGESSEVSSRIKSAGSRMAELLRALQQFVAVDTSEEKPAMVDLNAVLAEAHNAACKAHPACDADLSIEKLPTLEGYPRQLETMFLQLFDNAYKFRSPDRKLRIEVHGTIVQENALRRIPGRYEFRDFVQILFSDNGIGIASEYRESVFDLLNRLSSHNTQPACGLAICKKVAEHHYGSITIVTPAREGTTFKLLLPLRLRDIE